MSLLTIVYMFGILFVMHKLFSNIHLYLIQKIGAKKARNYSYLSSITICICFHIKMISGEGYPIFTWILTGLALFDLILRIVNWGLRKLVLRFYFNAEREIKLYKAKLKKQGLETDDTLDYYYVKLNKLYDRMSPELKDKIRYRKRETNHK